ncbi:MAG: hypothetical protein KDK06_20095 [Gammaproteobacteria bacterium]|nr:hypothetical protein [Gammaproteobacteria bacterium]
MNPTVRPEFEIFHDTANGTACINEPLGDGELRLAALAEWLLWRCDGSRSVEALHAELCRTHTDPPSLAAVRAALDELDQLGLLASPR